MEPIKIKDNSIRSKDSFSSVTTLVQKISNKTLEQLEKEGVFVFPEVVKDAKDVTKDQMILQRINDNYCSGNVMGFLGYEKERLIIESRFSNKENDFFFQYLLDRVLDFPNIVDLKTDTNADNRIFNYLLFLFPYYLKQAMRKGLYKQYSRYEYNDENFKGTLDIARHIKMNTPFVGKISYNQREFSYDNYLMELVRHTIEFIKQKAYGNRILSKIKEEAKLVVGATSIYSLFDRNKIIEANKKHPVRHAYYHEYLSLQKLCLMILQHQHYQIGSGPKQIFGILFDGAWLWEEYIYSLIKDTFHHPRNKEGSECQYLFYKNNGQIYPDFISIRADERTIADAKYKPINNIGNKDYLQVLAYIFRFDAKVGYYLYPEAEENEDKILWLNSGTTFEKNVKKREDICLIKHGLKIPTGVLNYQDFVSKMKDSEKDFRRIFP